MPSPSHDENKTIPREGEKFPQYRAALLATLGALSVGSYLSWTSAALPIYRRIAPVDPWDIQGSWLGSLVPLGALVGALPAGILADKLGRKKAVLAVAVPLLVSWLVIGFTWQIECLYIARFLAGVAAGATSVTVPMYVSEIAEPSVRGSLGTLFQLQITIGILFEYLTGLTYSLQYISLISATIPAILLVGFPFMPESPAWLISQGRRDDATAALRRLRGEHYQMENEINLLESNREAQKERVGLSELVRYNKTMIIALGLMVFQQMSGVNAVIFYAGQIFENAGSTDPTVPSIIIGIVQVAATYSSTLLVDRAGRKILLLLSSLVMAFCLFILAAYFHAKEAKYTMAEITSIPLIAVALFIVAFSLGFGPIPWMMVGELFPNNVKGHASSVSAATNWTMAFVVTNVFQVMVADMGERFTFLIFSSVCLIATAFVAIIVPETKGKTVEQIQKELYPGRKQPEERTRSVA